MCKVDRLLFLFSSGQTSSGKSTLLNLFLGEDILASQMLSCTATICELKYAEEKRAEVNYWLLLPTTIDRSIKKTFICKLDMDFREVLNGLMVKANVSATWNVSYCAWSGGRGFKLQSSQTWECLAPLSNLSYLNQVYQLPLHQSIWEPEPAYVHLRPLNNVAVQFFYRGPS